MARWLGSMLALALFLAPAVGLAQGVLIVTDPDRVVRLPRPIIIWPPHPPHPPRPIPPPPPPPATYKIKQLEVNAKLVEQVAQVQVSQAFENTGSQQLEVSFIFPLPYDGAIESMTLMVDGKEFPAKLLSAEEARRLYESIVRKNKDPALLEWMGTGMFKTNVFPVPAGATRTVSLRYSQVCRKQEGLTDFLFPLSTAKYTSHAVESVDIRLTIESEEDIKNVYSPTHTVEVKRPDARHATVTYSVKNEVPTADFRLLWDVGKEKVSTRVLSYRPAGEKEGYFLLLASPKIEPADASRPKKTVVFVLDRSGSMSGKKIEQARAALKFVIDNLREGDLLNIVAYDSQVEAFRPELQRFNDETRKAALGFVEGIYAGGSTNIDSALRAALAQLQDAKQPNYVVFLTDGLPTAGVTNEASIVANAKEANKVRARVFAFGVGYDVNSRLLDRLVRESFGQSSYVRPNEDIEEHVSRLYRRIESPVMTDVNIEFTFDAVRTEEGKPVDRVYPKGTFDLFAGEQLVVVGRYKKFGAAKVVVRGSVGGKEQKFDFPANLVEKSADESFAFVEKLWAIRRVGEILDELDVKGKNEELVKELVELSTRHGILTPYTSFLADETSGQSLAENVRRADVRLHALSATPSGAGGVAQRAYRGELQRATAARESRGLFADSFSRDRAAIGPAATPAPAAPGGGLGGMGFGAQAAGMPGRSAAAMPAADAGVRQMVEAAKEMDKAEQTVRNIGNRAFYRRGNQWVDSTLTNEQQGKATRVKQFSDEYFELARRHGRALSQYLVFDEPVLVNLEGRAYLVEP